MISCNQGKFINHILFYPFTMKITVTLNTTSLEILSKYWMSEQIPIRDLKVKHYMTTNPIRVNSDVNFP